MTSKFECEVRYIIKDIKAFEKRLEELGAKLVYPYEFTDHYFRPMKWSWNPLENNLRIRVWTTPKNPTTIFYVKCEISTIDGIQFKRALYPDGKVALFSGDLETCKSILKDLGFEFWFTVEKKNAKLWDVPKHGFKTVAESIEGLGWSGELEFEGDDPKKARDEIEKALKLLQIPKENVSFKPVSVLFAEKKGLLQ